ncbi:hypothetical protein JKP88DRAFT_272625 [Tribonema minus]|uniref:Uncharacterized protein n=1 Tax=Tribonema minus TaxID=303371 RepID=A0A836CIC5_9STRA|nr:hypothetical protein JKP88DRAFT_272625 [Tribonema minus]
MRANTVPLFGKLSKIIRDSVMFKRGVVVVKDSRSITTKTNPSISASVGTRSRNDALAAHAFEARRNKTFKTWINHVLASEIFETFIKPKTGASARVLALESAEFNTITAFKRQGVCESLMHVPNPCVRVCGAIRDAFPGVNVTGDTVGELIERTPHKYDVVFLDYMCTTGGNSMTQPLRDIKHLFGRKLLSTPAILATTFSQRNSTETRQEKLVRTVFESALANGYRMSQSYHPAMRVTAYLVREANGASMPKMQALCEPSLSESEEPKVARKRKAESNEPKAARKCKIESEEPNVARKRTRQCKSDADLVGKCIVWQGEKVESGKRSPQRFYGKVESRIRGDVYRVVWRNMVNVSMDSKRTRETLSPALISNAADAPYGSWHLIYGGK